MANPLRRIHLSRRAFLRGTGTAIALPFLDSMVPAMSRAPRAPVRSAFLFLPNGVKVDDWFPTREGVDYDETPLLAPLRDVRDQVVVFSGFAVDAARSHGDGTGDHARAAASFLTCVHPRKTGGADIQAGVSIDQWIAAHTGERLAFPSLELGMEGGAVAGVCDSGYSCAYSNNIAWKAPANPVAKEVDPRAVFARLFGDPDERLDAAEAARRRRRLHSVLDAAMEDLHRLRRDLPGPDRRKLDEYATAVRDVERRIERQDEEAAARKQDEVPLDVLDGRERGAFPGRLDLMYELLALAFRTDRTRVATFMLGNAGSDLSYPELGIYEGHHTLSHHRGDPKKLAAIGRINRFHVERVARFLGSLRAAEDAGGSLLDHSMVVIGSAIGDGNRHNHDQLPVLLAGGGGGQIASGRHIRFHEETPLANLYLTMLHVLGVDAESFGDSTGLVPGLLRA